MPTLEWIGKSKVINHHQEVPFRVLERKYSFDENGEHSEDNGSDNMIIRGDNLEALKALLPRYEGRVKCIYIDPPYNTGNEGWVYNDNVNDPKIKKWLGEVVGKEGDTLTARVLNDGTLGAHKSVNVPGEHIDLPALSDRDKRMIRLAIDQDIDFIAHSFVRSAKDVHAVQRILDAYHSDIKIISKIENQEGVDNIDEIIDASYGIMIARGDLGIEVPIEQIPGIQRRIIEKCIRKHKPVIVATQMLHTMINNPRPTRAEVTDIANAVFSHTDALMLSGETANGKYPLEAVQTMARVAEQAEQDAHREGYLKVPLADINQREFLSKSAIEATEYLGVKGIITDSGTGETARTLASFRGPNPVLAICYKEKLQRWLNLSYGIIAIHQQQHVTAQYMFTAALRMLRQKGFIGEEDKIAYLSGSLGKGNGTTFLEINQVKEVFNKHYRFHLPDTGI